MGRFRRKRGREDRHNTRRKKLSRYLKKQKIKLENATIITWHPNHRFKKRYTEVKKVTCPAHPKSMRGN